MFTRYTVERGLCSPADAVRVQGGKTGVAGPGLSCGQRVGYGLTLVGGRYVWARLSLLAAAQHWSDAEGGSWRHRAWLCMRRAEAGFKLLSLANLLMFLHSGAFRRARRTLTLLNALCCMPSRSTDRQPRLHRLCDV